MNILIVGLGNPGYERTRHNVGDLVVNTFLSPNIIIDLEQKYNCKIKIITSCDYMNICGKKIYFYSLSYDLIIVVGDDMETALGKLQFVYPTLGHRGHNGFRDVIKYLKHNFCTVRIGIGRPTNGSSVETFVLQKFTEYELSTILALESTFLNGLECFLAQCTSTK